MKTKFLFIIFVAFFSYIRAQNEFITIWKPSNLPTNTGTPNSTSTQIKFPGIGTNYTIYWEEVDYPTHNGTLNNVTSTLGDAVLINFGTPQNPTASNARYRVKVSNGNGNFSQIKFEGDISGFLGDNDKILYVSQWGNIAWTNMSHAFGACTYLDITATDIPNFSGVSDFSYMFRVCNSLVGNSSFNLWDMSSAVNLSNMFVLTSFNQPIGNWNTGNVTNMASMFAFDQVFNQPIGNWNTAKVTKMGSMFKNALLFNQPIGNWNTGKVIDMNYMFGGAELFNQPIGNWNTAQVTDMSYIFSEALTFNQPIGNWNTAQVTNMESMFSGAKSFNQPIENWNTGNVTNMIGVFNRAQVFNQPIGNWNTENVTNMASMFSNAIAFNQPIENWNTAKVTRMSYMFNSASVFNQPIGGWNTAKVTNMDGMFYSANAFDHNIGTWNFSSMITAYNMLFDSRFSCLNYDKLLLKWANTPGIHSNIDLISVSPLKYSYNSLAARNFLGGSKNWTISGDTYDATCAPALSTSEVSFKDDFVLYPNPARNFLYVKSIKRISDKVIYSMDGRIVKDIKSSDSSIDISDLPNGNYIVRMMVGGEMKTTKFTKE